MKESLIGSSLYRYNCYRVGSHVHTYALQECRRGEVIQNSGYFWLLHIAIIFDARTDYSINFGMQLLYGFFAGFIVYAVLAKAGLEPRTIPLEEAGVRQPIGAGNRWKTRKCYGVKFTPLQS